MNTYRVWHKGNFGYTFRSPNSGWWFVPEQGQPNQSVKRQLKLADLVFANAGEWKLELQREQQRQNRHWLVRLRDWLFPADRANTVAGLLLVPGLN
ncbi:MAG: hypothetical protein WD572_06800 [Gammaproteobacteria bacterium]